MELYIYKSESLNLKKPFLDRKEALVFWANQSLNETDGILEILNIDLDKTPQRVLKSAKGHIY